LSKWTKQKVKEAVNFIGNYEHSLAHYARIKHVDGIICGHIHSANISIIEDVEYMNCGDWVESCTALVETMDGKFQIIHWRQNNVDINTNSSSY
jgi:UDP-2,3-diacylglucosamine pyrophosphatase LpxH